MTVNKLLFTGLLSILFLYAEAAVTFDGGGTDDLWSTPENWSNDTVPTASDDVIITGTASVTINSAVQVNSLTLDASFSGQVNQSAAVNVTSNFVLNAGSWLANAQTINVGGNLAIANVAGLFQRGTSTVHLSGTGTISNPHFENAFHIIEAGAAGKTSTLLSNIYVREQCRVIAGKLKLTSGGAGYDLKLHGAGQLLDVQGHLEGYFPNGGEVHYEANGTGVVQVAGVNYGQCGIRLVTVSPVAGEFHLAGPLTNSHYLSTASDIVGGSVVFRTQSFPMTLTTFINIGNGNASLGGSDVYFGNSIIETGTFVWFTKASDNIFLENSRIKNHGSWWIWNPNIDVDPGTSRVTMADGDQISVAWNSKPAEFYDLVIDSDDGADTTVLNSDVNVFNNLTIVDGVMDNTGSNYDITVAADVAMLGNGVVRMGSGTLNIGGDLSIDDTAGVFVAGTSQVVMSGTGFIDNPLKDNAFYDLTVAAESKSTTLQSDCHVHGTCTVGAGFFGLYNADDAVAYDLYIRGTGTPLSVDGDANLFGNYGSSTVYFEIPSGETITIPAVDFGSCGLSLEAAGTTASTINQTGAITDCHWIKTSAAHADGGLVWNTNGHNVSVDVFIDVSDGNKALAGTTWNCGSSLISTNVNFIRITKNSDVVNMEQSTIECAGFFEAWGQSTLNPGTATLTMTGDDDHLGISWGNKTLELYNLTVAGDTLVVKDPLHIQGTFEVLADTQDRTVTFEKARTYTLANMHITGNDPYHVVLRSDTVGTTWQLHAAGLTSVDHVDVRDSDASGSDNPIDATAAGIDAGNNTNWLFSAGASEPLMILSSSNSYTSPAWVEGSASSYVSNIQIALDAAPAVAVDALSPNAWIYSNSGNAVLPGITLTPSAPIDVTVTGSSGTETFQDSASINWMPLDVNAYGISQMTIREGASLLWTVEGTGTAIEIDTNGDGVFDVAGAPGDTFPISYPNAGAYTVSGTIDGVPVGKTITVHVVNAQIAHARPAVAKDYQRVVPVDVIGSLGNETLNASIFGAGAVGAVSADAGTGYTHTFPLTAHSIPQPPKVMLRLGAGGPGFGVHVVDVFIFHSTAFDGFEIEIGPGGTVISSMSVIIDPLILNLDAEIKSICAATFADSSSVLSPSTNDFTPINGRGEYAYQIMRDADQPGICHSILMFQDAFQISP